MTAFCCNIEGGRDCQWDSTMVRDLWVEVISREPPQCFWREKAAIYARCEPGPATRLRGPCGD